MKIDLVSNGYILTFDGENGDEKVVIESVEDEHEAETTRRLLFEIMGVLGLFGSRHDEKRIKIDIVKGDKCDK